MRRGSTSVLDPASNRARRHAPVVLAAALWSSLAAQVPTARFAEMSKHHLPVIVDMTAAVLAGDVDGDGDLDLVIGNKQLRPTDVRQNRLYLNEGLGRFVDATAARMPVDSDWTSSLALGDVDGDGDVDLVVGNRYQQQSRLYLNDGTGRFTDGTAARMPANSTADTTALAMGDVDGDGDVDLVIGNAGQDLLYQNDGTGRFRDVTATAMPFDSEWTGSLALGDVDGDGDLDLAAGRFGHDGLYLNDGAGRFVDATAARLPDGDDDTYTVVLGDVDGDGDLDLAVGNRSVANPRMSAQNRLYLNDGTGRFVDVTATQMPVDSIWTSSLALGDVDGDGDLDLVAGNSGQNRLYQNDGTGRFTDATATRMPVDEDGTASVVLGDVDGDGDLDLVSGNVGENRLSLNDGTGGFLAAKQARMPALDGVASPRTLAAGDVDGDGDLDLVIGNSGQSRLCLNDGYGMFTDATPGRMPVRSEESSALALGDVDSDGDLDLVVGNTRSQNRLYQNDGTGRFTDVTGGRMPVDQDETMAVALGDVDGDGDLDLVFGNTWSWPPQSAPDRLYLNDGSGRFTDVTAAQMPIDSSATWALALGDVDGDGDLDLVVGNAGDGRPELLYLNDGGGRFTDVTSTQMPMSSGDATSLALGDVDGDGDLDLAIAFTAVWGSGGGAQDRLYLNDGAGRFADVTSARMPQVLGDTRSIAVADVDFDGDLDLVLGNLDYDGQQNRLYLNDGSGLFHDVTAAQMPVAIDLTVSVALADVDADGDPDLYVASDSPTRVDLYVNLARQLHAPYLLRIGEPWQLDVYARSGPARQVDVAFPFVSDAPAAIPLAPLGTLGIDPAGAVPLPVVVVPQPAGAASVSVPVPNAPSLVGVRIYAQAVLIQSSVPWLTSTLAEPIRDR